MLEHELKAINFFAVAKIIPLFFQEESPSAKWFETSSKIPKSTNYGDVNLGAVLLLSFIALMLLLTCLSVQAIDTVHMFRLTAQVDDVDKSVDTGLRSYCLSNPIKKAGRLVLLFSGATFYLSHPASASHIPAIGKC